jgi:hypothetical protein
MDIMIAVKKKDYYLFNKSLATGKFKYCHRYYEPIIGLLYYDCPRNLQKLNPGDNIYFYIYNNLMFVAKVYSIQLRFIPFKSSRIYFKEIKENKEWKQEKFNQSYMKNFKGEKYISIDVKQKG